MKILSFSVLVSLTFSLSIGRYKPTNSYWCGTNPNEYAFPSNDGIGSGDGSGNGSEEGSADGSGDVLEVQWELPVPESTNRSHNSNRKCFMMANGSQWKQVKCDSKEILAYKGGYGSDEGFRGFFKEEMLIYRRELSDSTLQRFYGICFTVDRGEIKRTSENVWNTVQT